MFLDVILRNEKSDLILNLNLKMNNSAKQATKKHETKSTRPNKKNSNRWSKEAYKYNKDNLSSSSFIYSSTSDEEEHALKIEMKKTKKLLKRRQRREMKEKAAQAEKEQEVEENGAHVADTKFDMFYPHLKYFHKHYPHCLPLFVHTMNQPRKLTYHELRTLRVNDKFAHEAHGMFFYPPGMAFYPILKK